MSREKPSGKKLETKNKILLVEDDDSIRQGLSEILEIEGYLVIEARNGEEGLERLWEDVPDLVLLDLRMPVMDGLEFKKIMDSHPGRSAIPVIAFSGNPSDVPPEMKAAGVLNKSAPVEKILQVIEQHLSAYKKTKVNPIKLV
jgi:CheY-like chemotaxis protein